MKTIIVDASVAIKWFVPEIHAKAAIRLLDEKCKLVAPSLILADIGNILWKKIRLKELTLNIATAILEDFKKMPLELHEHEMLIELAWKIATTYNCTIYDSLYVALAKIEKGLLVTADNAFYNTFKIMPLADLLLWVENI